MEWECLKLRYYYKLNGHQKVHLDLLTPRRQLNSENLRLGDQMLMENIKVEVDYLFAKNHPWS